MPRHDDPAFCFALESNKGRIALTIMGGMLDGVAKVLGYPTDNPAAPMIVITAQEARRLAAFVILQADQADKTTAEILGHRRREDLKP